MIIGLILIIDNYTVDSFPCVIIEIRFCLMLVLTYSKKSFFSVKNATVLKFNVHVTVHR